MTARIILFICILVSFDANADYFGTCFPKEISVTQSWIIDDKTNEAFGYNLKKITKNPELIGAVLSIYDVAKGGDMYPIKTLKPDPVLGHQGLSIQYINQNRYFWASMNSDERNNSGNYAIRFQLGLDGIVDQQVFKLFSEVKTRQAISPVISFDEKYLVVKMTKKNIHEIRVFDASVLREPGDFSKKYLNSFEISRDYSDQGPIALQAIASDGSRIYALMGSLKIGQNNRIDIFEINGKFLKSVDVKQGVEDAALIDSGKHYEPEGLTWLKKNNRIELLMTVAVGDQGSRKCVIYFTGIFSENY